MIIIDKDHVVHQLKKFPLKKHPKKYLLIQEFMRHFERNKEDLIQEIYSLDPFPKTSLRLWESAKQNVNKLISRSRKMLKQSFGEEHYEWLFYDQFKKKWTLYKKKE